MGNLVIDFCHLFVQIEIESYLAVFRSINHIRPSPYAIGRVPTLKSSEQHHFWT
jgi:hypothetical protein